MIAPNFKSQLGELNVGELAKRYLAFAAEYYRKPDGRATREAANMADALRPCVELSADLPIEQVGLSWLREVRQCMIDAGLARKTINARINRIRRVWRWAVENELCTEQPWQRLKALSPLKAGRSQARESGGIKPVSESDVEATACELRQPLADMVRLMWLTGMRVQELLSMTPGEVEQGDQTWTYRPTHHKTEHHGHERVIPLGPRARELLKPWLEERLSEPYLFPSLLQDRPVFQHGKGRQWAVGSFRQAIQRAASRAGVSPWTPLQLRHSAATRIRSMVGLEAARAVLGHKDIATTEIYAERDVQMAVDAMSLIG